MLFRAIHVLFAPFHFKENKVNQVKIINLEQILSEVQMQKTDTNLVLGGKFIAWKDDHQPDA